MTARADRAASWRNLTEALAADMADTQGGTTAEGIHLGAMAGTVDLLQRCYTGLHTRGQALVFDPALPGEITSLRLALAYRGHRLDVRLGHDKITVASAPCQAAPVTLELAGTRVTLQPGKQASQHLTATRRVPGQATGLPPGHREEKEQKEEKETLMATTTDPVCGMTVEESAAAGSTTHDGQDWYFCSSTCQQTFEADPAKYAGE